MASPLSVLLKRHRATQGLTQEALAERAGISVRTIKGMEQGASRLPRADTLARIVVALQLSPEDEAALRDAASKPYLARLAAVGEQHENDHVQQPGRAEWLQGAKPLTALIGREDLIQEALALLGDDATRMLTLVGPPGVGKTRIAVEVAHRVAEGAIRRLEHVVSVSLARLSQPSLLLPAIAHAMGLREAPGVSPRELLITALRGQTTLLVLDNFEHLLPAAPDLLVILAHCSNVKALVTSRAALRIRVERELPTPPLALTAHTESNTAQPPEMRHAPAVELFVQRAQATTPGFALDEQNAPVVAAICRAVDGLPLAIELAASRCRLFTPTALLARLTKRLPMLADRAQDIPPRQQTMRDAIAWSYQLLSMREQGVFRRLAVFVNGCSLAAAEAVCAPGGDAEPILDDLTTLIAHSLLSRTEGVDGAPRVTMLETIREFAQEQLEAEQEQMTAARSHCAYFCSYLTNQRTPQRGPDHGFDPRALEQEYANLRAALAWAIEQGDREAAELLVAGLWRFWYMQGMLTEGNNWTEATIAMSEGADRHTDAFAETLNGAGMLAFRQGKNELAKIWLERSLSIRRQLGDQRLVAATLNNLGLVAADQGSYIEAQHLHEESLAVKRSLGLRQDVAVSLNNLGCILRAQGHYAEALVCFEENLAIQRDAEDVYRLAHALGNLGSLAYTQGEFLRAHRFYQECLDLQRQIGDTQGIALSLLNLAEVAAAQGDVRQALVDGQASLDMFRAFGEPTRMVSALTLLSYLYSEQGDETRAVASMRTALDLYRQVGERRTAHRWLAALALLAQRHALPERAVQFLAVGEAQRMANGAAWSPTESRHHKSMTAQLREDMGQAAFLVAWDDATSWSWEITLTFARDVLSAWDDDRNDQLATNTV